MSIFEKIFRKKKEIKSNNEDDFYSGSDAVPTQRTKADLVLFSWSRNVSMCMEECYTYTAESRDGKAYLTIESAVYNDGEKFVTEIPHGKWERLVSMINEYDLQGWNGFSKYAKHICDGGGFSLSMEFADGKYISAHGTNAYPKNYGSAKDIVEGLFSEYRKKYAYDRLPKTLDCDDMDMCSITFIQKGKSGMSEYSFEFRSECADGMNNIHAKYYDADGEFVENMRNSCVLFGKAENVDLSKIQESVRKYDLPALNGYDKSAENYNDCEWFQLNFYYESGEYFGLCGTLHPKGYDDMRHDLLAECFELLKLHNDVL